MKRASTAEKNKRINHAFKLLAQGFSPIKARLELIDYYGLSKRQAYRYIEKALTTEHILVVPEEKVVFTVKLPLSLVENLRSFSQSIGQSLSEITAQALRNFLRTGGEDGKKDQSENNTS